MISMFSRLAPSEAGRSNSALVPLYFVLTMMRVASLEAQESPNLPSGISLGGRVSQEQQPAADAETVLGVLAKKANGDDAVAAGTLVSRILSGGKVAMDAEFQKQVESASPAEAARILGLTLLRTTDTALQNEGLVFLDKAVEGESVLAMEAMARILLEGRFGREKSVEKAVELLKRARQIPGATEAHRLLGDLALAGTGMKKDAAIALEYYRRGAEAGAVSSLLALHRLFREEGEIPKDTVEAERYGRAAADSGNAEASYEMGIFFEQYAGDDPEWLRAAEWMGKAAERGHLPATLRLADYHLEGRLGGVNSAEGTRLLRVAAGLGSPEACFRIAEAYKTGTHLPQDPVASTAWFRVAADLGFAPAENAYGLALATGYGVASDPVGSVEWFKRAAEDGWADAQTNLGELHQHGVGVEKNLKEAAKYYEAAAGAGSGQAAESLARLLSSDGEPALRDLPKAAYWASRAAAAGRPEAKVLADRLRAELNPAQQAALDKSLSAEPIPEQ